MLFWLQRQKGRSIRRREMWQSRDETSHGWNTDETRILRWLTRFRVLSVFHPWLNLSVRFYGRPTACRTSWQLVATGTQNAAGFSLVENPAAFVCGRFVFWQGWRDLRKPADGMRSGFVFGPM
jgi:hypothetical protein